MNEPVFCQVAIDQRISLEEKMPVQEITPQQKAKHRKTDEEQLIPADCGDHSIVARGRSYLTFRVAARKRSGLQWAVDSACCRCTSEFLKIVVLLG
jgi:hypothetical protein